MAWMSPHISFSPLCTSTEMDTRGRAVDRCHAHWHHQQYALYYQARFYKKSNLLIRPLAAAPGLTPSSVMAASPASRPSITADDGLEYVHITLQSARNERNSPDPLPAVTCPACSLSATPVPASHDPLCRYTDDAASPTSRRGCT